MHRTTLVPALASIALMATLTGCGGSSSSSTEQPPTPPVATGDLKRVASPDELELSIKAGFLRLSQAPEVSVSSLPGIADFSGTYTQEANVDEADSVRYDGDYLYVAPERFYQCCFIAADGPSTTTPPSSTPPTRAIRILQTDASTAQVTPAGSIELEDGVSVQGMYVENDRLFALTGTAYYGHFGDFWASTLIWAPERIGFRVYDVADKTAPTLQSQVEIDGVLVDSRRVGNTVYIVSRYAPSVDGLLYTVTTAAEQSQNEALLATVSLADLLPKVSIDGTESVLVDPTNCYLTTGDDGGFPVITSVTQVPIDNPSALSTTCYNEEVHGAYLTETSLYFTAVNYSATSDEQYTNVHKFGLGGGVPEYRGSAEVAGHIWRGGQSDFRMSEHAGDLRMITASYTPDVDDFVDHNLYVLRESATAPELTVIGELPNAQRPQEIGKPNEMLYGVRFLGDRAYAVTFERTDPLYTLDLSDPTDPKIAGELTVTGFSDFLHPVSDALLLGLGTADDGGVKVELFDVSVIAQPLSRGAVSFGPGTWSESIYNRHAFAYLPGAVDRFTIPLTRVESSNTFGYYVTGLQLLEIRDKSTPNLATLNSAGEMTPPLGLDRNWVERNRAYLNDDALFYVRDDEVWGAMWQTPDVFNGPF